MTSPALQRMAERAKLPISVDFRDYNHAQRRNGARDHFEISWPGRRRTLFVFRDTAEAATRAYLALCESLSYPTDPLPSAGTAADCSAPVAPIGVR
jgi:hypothetical protein